MAIAGLSVFASGALAQDSNGQYTLTIQRLAEKFRLREEDVQSVFESVREERKNQMQKNWEERLDQAVKDGKITEAQKQAILKKQQEFKDKRVQNKEDLEKWVRDNNIDLKTLFPFGGMGFKMGFRHFK